VIRVSRFWYAVIIGILGYASEVCAMLVTGFALALVTGYLDSFAGLFTVSLVALPKAIVEISSQNLIILLFTVLAIWYTSVKSPKFKWAGFYQLVLSQSLFFGLTCLASSLGATSTIQNTILISFWLGASQVFAIFIPAWTKKQKRIGLQFKPLPNMTVFPSPDSND
jgi:hypothetical protein